MMPAPLICDACPDAVGSPGGLMPTLMMSALVMSALVMCDASPSAARSTGGLMPTLMMSALMMCDASPLDV